MSLFTQLRQLYRRDKFELEDFQTEIVAQVLRNNQRLAVAWLNGIGASNFTISDSLSMHVATQEEFARLVNHRTDSRPDIAIRLNTDDDAQLVLVESKIGSRQGPDQLQRYVDQLAAVGDDLTRTSLVFITCDFENVESSIASHPSFRYTRWFEFYRYLKIHTSGDGLERQLQLFMEENHMSLGNQFKSIDLVAMENFQHAKALMDETLAGEVSREAGRILGKVTAVRKAIDQFRDHNAYVIWAGFGRWDFFCSIGYWFPDSPDDPIWVGITLESNPKSSLRKKVITSFRAQAKNKGWEANSLDDPKEWAAVYKRKAIGKFLSEQDHIRAIKNHFLELLQEVKRFRASNRQLPWRKSSVDDVEKD